MTALLLEPFDGHPAELAQFVEEHLEAPFLGTVEAKAAATRGIFDTFEGMEETAKKMVARAEERAAKKAAEEAAAAAEAEEAAAAADTPSPYPDSVQADDTRDETP